MGSVAGLVVVGAAFALALRPSAERQEAREAATNATRPRDLAPAQPAWTAPSTPSPVPTATPRPLPDIDPSLTLAEMADMIRFASWLLSVETRQRGIVRDYRIYDVELLTRWIGESFTGAETLLDRQRGLLEEVRAIEGPEIEGADGVLSLYEDSLEEGVGAFERLVDALHPLHEAGVSVVVGIRTGMLPNMRIQAGLSRSAMARRDARERLESFVNRAGLTLGDVEKTRGPDGEDI